MITLTYLIRGSFLLVLFCLACHANAGSDGIEFTVRGTITTSYASNISSLQRLSDFEVMVKGRHWLVRTEPNPSSATTSSPVKCFESAFDGTNVFYTVEFNEQPDNREALSASIGLLKDRETALLKARVDKKHLLPIQKEIALLSKQLTNTVNKKPWNQGAARAFIGRMPSFDDSDSLAILWLCFASREFFSSLSPKLVPDFLHDNPILNRSNAFVHGQWQLLPSHSALPLTVWFTNDGARYVLGTEHPEPNNPTVVKQPIGEAALGAEYKVLSTKNHGWIVLPDTFRYSRFVYSSSSSLDNAVFSQTVGMVSYVTNEAALQGIPRVLTPRLATVDHRFQSGTDGPQIRYAIGNGSPWPSIEQVVASPAYNRDVQTYEIAKTRRSLAATQRARRRMITLVLLFGLLAVPVCYYVIAAKRQPFIRSNTRKEKG